MLDTSRKTIATLTAAACLGGGSWAIAQNAGDSTTTSPQGAQPQGKQHGSWGHRGMGARERVTGDALQKAKDAILARVPGATIERVEKDPQGYHAHITKSDGTAARVRMDADMTVTAVEAGRGMRGMRGGPGKMRPAELTGDALAKVTAAVQGRLAGATVDHAHRAPTGDGYVALVTKKDGSRALVQMDAKFAVTGVSTAPMRGGRGGPGKTRPAELTGDALAKVTAAVQGRLAGATVDHAHRAPTGDGYVALVTKKDGSRALVQMDAKFAVTGVSTAPMRGRGGPGGPGGAKRGETPLTGDNATKATAAALAKLPGATVERVETDADGAAYEAHVTTADGSRATVKMDKGFNVTAVEEG